MIKANQRHFIHLLKFIIQFINNGNIQKIYQ